MGRGSLAPLLVASLTGACQAFTGTGDLEVRESASTSGAGASSSAASAGGGEGGSGGSGGTGQGAGQATSAGGSQATSAGGAGGCPTCGSTFESGGDPSEICEDFQHNAYVKLHDCLCGTTDTGGSCYDPANGATSPCGGFCSAMGGGQPPDQGCKDCASDLSGCPELLQECMN